MDDMIDFKSVGKMINFKIVTVHDEVEFCGRYRKDLEKSGWHYYERDDGMVLHFRKKHMVVILQHLNLKKQKKEMKKE